MTGRYAPSPSGDLHLGNLRTAILAWLWSRSGGERFLLRVEDLDRVAAGAVQRQTADLRAVGLDWDEPVWTQSQRLAEYARALDALAAADLVYECYCTRAEIAQAATAPHAPPGAYPGTCRNLTEQQRAVRRRERESRHGQAPALRLRAATDRFTVHDEFAGRYTAAVDDFVLRRGDGMPAYNLASVVDDAASGVTQVIRGDDLLPSSPRQAYLATLLGYEPPSYAHVPLVLNPQGRRLAKRDGAVTLADLQDRGWTVEDVVTLLGRSLSLPPGGPARWVDTFDPAALPRRPWTLDPKTLGDGPRLEESDG